MLTKVLQKTKFPMVYVGLEIDFNFSINWEFVFSLLGGSEF